jgi:hypothetical protein
MPCKARTAPHKILCGGQSPHRLPSAINWGQSPLEFGDPWIYAGSAGGGVDDRRFCKRVGDRDQGAGASTASGRIRDRLRHGLSGRSFEQHCYECHGPKKSRGRLRLDSRAAGLKGGRLGTCAPRRRRRSQSPRSPRARPGRRRPHAARQGSPSPNHRSRSSATGLPRARLGRRTPRRPPIPPALKPQAAPAPSTGRTWHRSGRRPPPSRPPTGRETQSTNSSLLASRKKACSRRRKRRARR